MPQRGCASANRVSSATAPGVTSMSEFEAITNGALVAATPRLMFAPKPSVRSLAITSASRVEGEPPGLTVSDQLVHLRRERVQARAGIRVAGRPDHDRGDAHEQLPVGLERQARGLGPRVLGGAGEAGLAQALVVGERAFDPAGEGDRVAGLDQHGRVPGDLGQRAGGGGDHGRARGHRLEQRQAEALVAAGEDEAGRPAVEPGQLVLRHVAAELDRHPEPGRRLLGLGAAALVGADEHEPRRALADQRERLDRGRRLLARLQGADEERVRLAVGRRAVGAEGGVGGERRDRDLLLGDGVELDQVALGQLRDREHARGLARRARARPPGRSAGRASPSPTGRARTRGPGS